MKQAQKHWGFDRRDMNTAVRPQDDFFQYAGGKWIERNPIPKEESRWGNFVILRRKVDTQLHEILTKLQKRKRVMGGTPEQMIRDFYLSGIDMPRRKKLGLSPLKHELAMIAGIKDVEGLVSALARLGQSGLGGLWGTMIDQDMKNSERYILHLWQSGLTMPDRDYYLKDDAESKRVRDAYVKHLQKLHALMGQSKKIAAESAQVIMKIETAIAQVSMPKEELRDVDKVYHKMSAGQLAKLAPQINWRQYLDLMGADVKDVIVGQPKFFVAAQKILRTHSIEEWQIYLTAQVVGGMSSYLTPALERESFNFWGKTISGTKQMRPLWRRVLSVVNGHLGEAFGQIYVKEYFAPEAKLKIVQVADDLFAAYKTRIQQLEWMSPATKKKALKKLAQMTRKLAYPDKWKSYKGLVIKADDYVGNALRSAVYEHKRAMRKLHKPVDRKEWFMTPQTVNAYCNFGTNDIAFPAAILQPPFFDVSADDAINYGSIGSVIGHEITHGFDDQGSKFDGKGNRKTWWTTKDRKLFEKKAKVLVQQFNQYTVADGVKVNGQLTLGENIADLGGLSIAYDAYQLKLRKNGRADLDGFTPEQRFFLAASLFERVHARPEVEKMYALTDPHSPAIFRVNGPFSNLPEFYASFGVSRTDKLYRAPASRAKIW
jgi:putative endopeptidase